MISIERALEIVREALSASRHPKQTPSENVELAACVGRILREDIIADTDYPRFDKAIRDGFAVRAEDVANVPVVLKVISESRAGFPSSEPLTRGTCCEIMTGAPLPSGANAVVMVEHTERLSESEVRLLRSARDGEGLLRRAAELREGDRVLSPGRRLQLADTGTLANFGKARVLVSKKPRVAILATGDELVEVHETPEAGQIRNSNTYTLSAQVTEAGAEPVVLGIGRDNMDDLRARIGAGLEYDVLLVSGGVSMGKYDFVENVFAEFGVEVLFDSVAMKPGKPTVFGRRGKTFVFGLPGNPVSTIVAFHMFVRPVLRSLLGASDNEPVLLRARLETATKRDPARSAIVPAAVRFDGESYRIQTAPWKGSSDLAGVSLANAMIVIPQGEGALQPGDWAEFLLLERG